MPSIIADLIAAAIGAIIASGITWYISLRKLRPEIASIQAQAEESQAEAWKKLTDAQQARLDQLTRRVIDLECKLQIIQEAREKTALENDQLRDRVRELEAEVKRIPVLEEKIKQLERELEEWRTGKKRKTGPLP